MPTRREFLRGSSFTVAGSLLMSARAGPATAAAGARPLQVRKIPATGEAVPVIGMGTSGSFEVSLDGAEYRALAEVLKRFIAAGATLIDTAPTYGNAEDVLGRLLEESEARTRVFLATKLSGVRGRARGFAQFERTLRTLRTDRVELLQVHNLRDWKSQLAVARELKQQGKVRYVGVTHYLESAQDELADIVQATKPDFLQINYSVTQRNAERRVFPLARDLGIAVLANRNFDDGALFRRVRGKALPEWAAEAGIASWAQMFLKFVLSEPAVTAVIPATGKPDRQSDNLGAGVGPLLTPAQKAQVVELIG